MIPRLSRTPFLGDFFVFQPKWMISFHMEWISTIPARHSRASYLGTTIRCDRDSNPAPRVALHFWSWLSWNHCGHHIRIFLVHVGDASFPSDILPCRRSASSLRWQCARSVSDDNLRSSKIHAYLAGFGWILIHYGMSKIKKYMAYLGFFIKSWFLDF